MLIQARSFRKGGEFSDLYKCQDNCHSWNGSLFVPLGVGETIYYQDMKGWCQSAFLLLLYTMEAMTCVFCRGRIILYGTCSHVPLKHNSRGTKSKLLYQGSIYNGSIISALVTSVSHNKLMQYGPFPPYGKRADDWWILEPPLPPSWAVFRRVFL